MEQKSPLMQIFSEANGKVSEARVVSAICYLTVFVMWVLVNVINWIKVPGPVALVALPQEVVIMVATFLGTKTIQKFGEK
jgi:hypothetical protein